MLVLTRKPGERILIGDNIVVTILDSRGDGVRIGIDAPRGITIQREEVLRAVTDANLAAAGAQPEGADLIKAALGLLPAAPAAPATAPPVVLPAAVSGFLADQVGTDHAATLAHFADDATVVDDGKSFAGRDAILGWLSREASEFTFTSTTVKTEKHDDARYTVTNHLEGNFPGGTADLRFQFFVSGGRIASLTIQP
ncbi:carbon storage regulator CsrA [Conyzicola nivalis]|uniref:Translational regulator CsrA n=1 Tax=Conyzicola nivalis TaxID=1477021 RepID=A0ABV2QUA6_9MICO